MSVPPGLLDTPGFQIPGEPTSSLSRGEGTADAPSRNQTLPICKGRTWSGLSSRACSRGSCWSKLGNSELLPLSSLPPLTRFSLASFNLPSLSDGRIFRLYTAFLTAVVLANAVCNCYRTSSAEELRAGADLVWFSQQCITRSSPTLARLLRRSFSL